MAHLQGETPEYSARPTAYRVVLAATFLFMLAAVSVSTGLVVYSAWFHDLKNGAFALLFATLSVRAALSWCLWLCSGQHSAVSNQQDREDQKLADDTLR